MKRCPTCNRTYTDLSLNFCLEDGTPLITGAADPNATIRYPGARDASEPPPTEIYRPTTPAVSSRPTAPPPPAPPQWSPTPAQPPRKKSNAVWWILGGLAAVAVIGVGLVVMLIALASLGSNVNNSNVNANTRNQNRNSNISANANANSNTNTSLPASIADDFSEQKWGIANSPYGRTWYDDDEYRMVSKERTFVVMYAPSDAYNTENARVSVTARSVDGSVPSAGFGLIVHGELKGGKLEDYALLIYPDEEPSYQIVMHKNGTQSTLVDKTKTEAIKPGSAPNELEIRIKGTELLFYANGQLLNRVKDAENYRRGLAGFYTSDIHEVAFDDLVINR